MSARIVTKRQELAIARSFQNGKSATEIAKRMKMPRHRIYEALKRRGLKPEDQMRRGSPPTPKRLIDKVIKAYLTPMTITATAKTVGLSYGGARFILEKAGLLRPDGRLRAFSDEEEREMAELYQGGASQTEIAKKCHTSQNNVSRTLRKLGIEATKRKPASGSDHGSYKGGRHLLSGYVRVLVGKSDPLYCMAANDGYVMEHRLVMARHLGRALSRGETIHHINGDKSDNRIANLQIRKGNHGTGVVLKCARCGSTDIIESPI